MATVAEFTMPPETFLLGAVFETHPDAVVEIERVVPTGSTVMPYFWIEGVDGETVRESLSAVADFETVTLVDSACGRSLFRCECVGTHEGLLGAIVDSDVTMLSAVGTESGWRIDVRGDEQRAITAFDRACRDAGIVPTLSELTDAGSAAIEGAPELTDRQRAALTLAHERGYFSEPRTTTLEEIATELGISRQALSNRLRRGYRTLVESYVLET